MTASRRCCWSAARRRSSFSPVVAAFLGILLGGGFGALLLAAKKADRKTRLAFGPFLCIGIAAAMFFGERLADWYIGLL